MCLDLHILKIKNARGCFETLEANKKNQILVTIFRQKEKPVYEKKISTTWDNIINNIDLY